MEREKQLAQVKAAKDQAEAILRKEAERKVALAEAKEKAEAIQRKKDAAAKAEAEAKKQAALKKEADEKRQ